ncbi:hypothetical protein JYB62_06830 [Algoriphagus lutimaris]|uniref:anti-phage protein KwaA n=1 Tax=Algoriphagus lutimaris TaxID=613197 RepID=UPI00196A8999|nr:anti-phage protein KwaA [Algoriphagus lutimaris]MBN3519713.1 hypothetical protein [Algoriphagus lutimaris]
MRLTIQILLFVISYVPLYFILFFQNLNDKLWTKANEFIGIKEALILNKVSLAFLILIIGSVSLYFILYKIVIKSSHEEIKVVRIQDNHAEHLSYLATYILPFIGLKFDTWQNILSTVALFYILGHIYIKTNLILTNPTLTLFGYHISKIENDKEKMKIIIHKQALKKGQTEKVVHLTSNVYLQKITE